jgi:hypothetical protein
MQHSAIDLLTRALAATGSRRTALAVAGAIFFGVGPDRTRAQRDSSQRTSTREAAFSRKCGRFIIAAGPHRTDKFRHIDDDLRIEIIPKSGGAPKTVLNDNNNAPNGANGDHLRVEPFTAKVGDQVHIVARNEQAGGCELDEIWLHCIEGRGGKVKLTDRISPRECRRDADRIGVFFDKTIRIKNR